VVNIPSPDSILVSSRVPSLRLPVAETLRMVLLLSLPVSQLVIFSAGGVTINLVDLLLPIQLLGLFLLLVGGGLTIPRYQLVAGLLLLITIAVLLFVSVYVKQQPAFRYLKIAVGQTFVFFVFVLFSRSTPQQAVRHLVLLAWAGAVTTVLTVALAGFSLDVRLDSLLWGRSNVFGAALVLSASAGWVALLTYRRYTVALPVLVTIAGIILTQSRGSLLILASIVGFTLALRGRRPLQSATIIVVLVAVVGTVFVALPANIYSSVPVLDRFATEADNIQAYLHSGSDYDRRLVFSGRLYVWESGMQAIAMAPWTGTTVRNIYAPRWAGEEARLVEHEVLSYHNWAITITADNGLIVLVLNIVTLIVILLPFRRLSSVPRRLILVVLLGLVAYGLVEPMFESGFFALNIIGPLYWILAGTGLALPEPQDALASGSR